LTWFARTIPTIVRPPRVSRSGLENQQKGSVSSETSALCAMSPANTGFIGHIDQLISASSYANRVRLISPECPRAFTPDPLQASEFFRKLLHCSQCAERFGVLPASEIVDRTSSDVHGTFGLHEHLRALTKLSSFTGHLACPEITRLTFVASRLIGV